MRKKSSTNYDSANAHALQHVGRHRGRLILYGNASDVLEQRVLEADSFPTARYLQRLSEQTLSPERIMANEVLATYKERFLDAALDGKRRIDVYIPLAAPQVPSYKLDDVVAMVSEQLSLRGYRVKYKKYRKDCLRVCIS